MQNYESTGGEVKDAVSASLDPSLVGILDKLLGSDETAIVTPTLTTPTLGSLAAGKPNVVVFDLPDVATSVDLRNYPASGQSSLEVLLFGEGDSVNLALPRNFSGLVVLGDGDNTVNAARGSKAMAINTGEGDDTVRTGAGRDTIVIAGGNDSISTGSGNDTVIVASGYAGQASVNAGAGLDTLDLSAAGVSRISGSSAELGSGGTVSFAGFERLVVGTTSGDDSVTLGRTQDTVLLSGGSDSIATGAGNDVIAFAGTYTGTFGDQTTISGGQGTDTLDLRNVEIASAQRGTGAEARYVVITLTDGSRLLVESVERFIYDDLGPVKTVGVQALLNENFPDS